MSDDKPGYFAILPAKIRYADDLSSSQILMFAEITALSNKDGYCSASNNYFAKLYDVDPSTVSKWVTGLKKGGYIKVEYHKENGQIKGRKVRPLVDHKGSEINQGGIEKTAKGVLKKDQGGIEKNAKHNNTSNNNTRENNNAREEPTLPEKIEQCDTVKALSDIWFNYRKEKNKFPGLSEQEMLRHQMSQWGLPKSKKIVSKAITNGWLSLKEDYVSDTEQERSHFRPDAVHL